MLFGAAWWALNRRSANCGHCVVAIWWLPDGYIVAVWRLFDGCQMVVRKVFECRLNAECWPSAACVLNAARV
eukprot:11221649-Lingulodinium_polyedra.AAC.1